MHFNFFYAYLLVVRPLLMYGFGLQTDFKISTEVVTYSLGLSFFLKSPAGNFTAFEASQICRNRNCKLWTILLI
jgi:hypothetical protein